MAAPSVQRGIITALMNGTSLNRNRNSNANYDSDKNLTDLPVLIDDSASKPVATASSSNATTSLATSASSSDVTCTLSASNESDLEDFVLVQPKRKRPLRRAALKFRQTLGSTHSHQQTGHISGTNALPTETNPIEVIDSEDEELQQVLEESLLSCTEKTPSKMGDIQTLLKIFKEK